MFETQKCENLSLPFAIYKEVRNNQRLSCWVTSNHIGCSSAIVLVNTSNFELYLELQICKTTQGLKSGAEGSSLSLLDQFILLFSLKKMPAFT